MLFSANWPESRQSHWDTLLRARAIENHQYVIYCNRVGQNKFYTFCGESCLVNPFGEIVAELSHEEGFLTAKAPLVSITQSKTLYDYLDERRDFFKP